MECEEDYSSHRSQEEQYYEGYTDLAVHRVMLSDRPRMDFYKRVLTDPNVVGGKVVVDVGSGSGVLSAWAALAGAAHVLSIEASSVADAQPALFLENDIADRVTVLRTTVEALVKDGAAAFLAEHRGAFAGGCGVGLIVSEWMGFYLVHEAMLPSVLRARDFFTQVNALLGVNTPLELVPSSARLLAAPMHLAPLYTNTFQSFWGCIDGIKMETYGRLAFDLAINEASPLVEVIPASCLLVSPDGAAVLWQRDLQNLDAAELAEIEATAQFQLAAPPPMAGGTAKSGSDLSVDGFTLWFEVRYGDLVLSTAPRDPATHWKQTTILLPQQAREERLITLSAVAGSTLDVKFSLRISEPGSRFYTLSFELC